MAREIITKIWCDVCIEEEVYVEGSETPPIILGNWKPRVLALCERHKKEVYEPLEQMVRELGQILPEQTSSSLIRPPGTSPGSGTFPCPDPKCSKHTKPYKHEQSLRNHARDIHGVRGLKELSAMFSGAPEAEVEAESSLFEAEVEDRPKITSVTCVDAMKDYTGSTKNACDVSYAWPEYKRPAQAMGVHLAKKHGVRGKKHDKKTVAV